MQPVITFDLAEKSMLKGAWEMDDDLAKSMGSVAGGAGSAALN